MIMIAALSFALGIGPKRAIAVQQQASEQAEPETAELQQIYLPELGMCWGPACNSLKKLWKSYKIAGRNGEPRRDIAWKINAIQKAMGIEKSEFPELEGMETSDEEMADEEIQLKREEREDAGDWGFEKPEESYTDEWSEEDKQLRREEREAEEDWWFS